MDALRIRKPSEPRGTRAGCYLRPPHIYLRRTDAKKPQMSETLTQVDLNENYQKSTVSISNAPVDVDYIKKLRRRCQRTQYEISTDGLHRR